MKKLLLFVSLLSVGVCVWSLAITDSAFDKSEYELFYPYTGPSDDAVTDPLFYGYSTRNYTTFGQLAKLSGIIAFGQVMTQDWKNVMIRVETPLVGCTNGQLITINKWNNDVPEEDHMYTFDDVMDCGNWEMYLLQNYPTNNARVVFCVSSNYYGDAHGSFNWNGEQSTNRIEFVYSTYRLRGGVRSWWDPNRDDGILTEHFTNVFQAVRIDRNWTNYFHLCRDGMYKDSIRVKEDSYYDMRGIIENTNKNQAHFIYNDPLVLPEHKAYLLELKPYVGE